MPHFMNWVALEVALELELHVEVERVLGAEVVDHDRVVDHESTGTSGSFVFASFAHLVGDVAHRGEVGEQGHAGEVLQHDAGDDEGHLVEARCVRLPAGEL